MASTAPKADDVLHAQSKPATTTATTTTTAAATEPQISSGSFHDHDTVEKIDRTPSYEKPMPVIDSANGDVETADRKYGSGVEEKAMSTSEDESLDETKRKSKLRTLWIKYRIFGHLAIWLVMTA